MPTLDFSDLPAENKTPSKAIDFSDLPQETSAEADVAKTIPSALVRGAAYTATAPLEAAHWAGVGMQGAINAVRQHFGYAPVPDVSGDWTDPTTYSRPVVAAMDSQLYHPKTTAGQYANTAAEFVPGALMGGEGMVANALKYGVLPGLASEAAGQATQGTPLEPIARVAAPILTGGVASLATRPGTAASALSDAAGSLDQPTLDAAQSLMDAAQKQGTPLSLAEAVQQVTNGGTRLGSLQRVVEQSRGGAEPMAQFYADRPQQVQQAGNAAIDQVGPAPAAPSTVAPAVQKAAQDTIGDAYAARTAAVSPLYKAAGTDQVPAGDVNGVIADLGAQMAADKTGLLAGPLGDLQSRLIAQQASPGTATIAAQPMVPITDIENLDRTRKYFRDRTDLPQFAPNAIDKETGSKITGALSDLDTAMTNASPNYAQAKQAYQNITQQQVDPLEQGMIGALSRSSDFGQQANVILNTNPLPGSENEVANAVAAVKAKSPGAAQALVSQRIRQAFNEATQNNMGGPNQWGAPKFASVIAGNDQQARNLRAAVSALQGPQVWDDFRKTLDVFEAMGRRQAPGSQTEFNRQISGELQKGGKLGEFASTVASPSTALAKARSIYEGWRYGRNTRELAGLLTRPDAARVLSSIAKKAPSSPSAQGQAAMYLLNTSANQGRHSRSN